MRLLSLEIYKHSLVLLILGYTIVDVSKEDVNSNYSIRVKKFNIKKIFQMVRFANHSSEDPFYSDFVSSLWNIN